MVARAGFRDTAVIHNHFKRFGGRGNAGHSFGFTSDFQALREVACGSVNSYRYLRSGGACIRYGDGDDEIRAVGEARIGGFDVKIRKARIRVNPIVKEPAEIALGLRFQQAL